MRRGVSSLILATMVAGLFPTCGFAAIFVGSGLSPENSNPVSGKVEFSIAGDLLSIVLTNTTAGGTGAQGDALTGVVFNTIANPLPFLSLSSIQLTGGSNIYVSSGTMNNSGLLSGSWTDQLGSSASPDFGVATTGFNGLFVGGSISRGNASPNYGIIAGTGVDGTGSMRSGFGGSRYPFILNSLTFTFTGATGLLDSQIGSVNLLFGTAGGPLISTTLVPPPDGGIQVDGNPVATPEPSSMLVFAGLFAAFGGYRRLRRRND